MGRVCAEDRVCSLSAVHSERARWLLYEGGATRGGPPATWPGPGLRGSSPAWSRRYNHRPCLQPRGRDPEGSEGLTTQSSGRTARMWTQVHRLQSGMFPHPSLV